MKTLKLIQIPLLGIAAVSLVGCPEVCDDGKDNDRDDATDCQDDDCSLEDACNVCGDGALGALEECDDGNTTDGDGCTSACTEEFCGDGTTQPNLGEECDDGGTQPNDGCDEQCLIEFCGDEIVQPGLGEECDDGNTTDGDGCNSGCLEELCGDGIVQPNLGEDCDDGGALPGDGCSEQCLTELCGDGVMNNGTSQLISVRFEYLTTTCYSAPPETFFFTVGGVSVESPPNNTFCVCPYEDEIESFETTDPAFLQALELSGNTITVSFDQVATDFSWATARLNFEDGTHKDIVVFDVDGGEDALWQNPDMCNAHYV